MPEISGGAGRDAEHRGSVAERTFLDMLDSWLAGTGAAAPSVLVPDSQKVDIQVTVPSLWAEVEGIQMNWQIKASIKAPQVKRSELLRSDAFHYPMARKDLLALYEYSRSAGSLYLALAIQRMPSAKPSDLVELPPFYRFDWFALDLKQYFERTDWRNDAEHLHIPVHNVLNLASFSLLWGGRWVEQFFAPLVAPQVVHVPELSESIRAIFHPERAIDFAEVHGWNFLLQELPARSIDLDRALLARVKFRAGVANALGLIRRQIRLSYAQLEEIRIYCPEALFGIANLWLFSAAHRHYMVDTGELSIANRAFLGERMFPLPEDEITSCPRILLCAIWHSARYYGSLGTRVSIVVKPTGGAGDHHSHYGGAIGYFPWITLSSDRADWVIESKNTGTAAEHIEYMNERLRTTVLSSQHSVIDAAGLFGVEIRQMDLPATCPVMLLPPESVFLRYPRELFGFHRLPFPSGSR